jgi:uncharacterized membrane-anchored protein
MCSFGVKSRDSEHHHIMYFSFTSRKFFSVLDCHATVVIFKHIEILSGVLLVTVGIHLRNSMGFPVLYWLELCMPIEPKTLCNFQQSLQQIGYGLKATFPLLSISSHVSIRESVCVECFA